jgi:hypothetical protein
MNLNKEGKIVQENDWDLSLFFGFTIVAFVLSSK